MHKMDNFWNQMTWMYWPSVTPLFATIILSHPYNLTGMQKVETCRNCMCWPSLTLCEASVWWHMHLLHYFLHISTAHCDYQYKMALHYDSKIRWDNSHHPQRIFHNVKHRKPNCQTMWVTLHLKVEKGKETTHADQPIWEGYSIFVPTELRQTQHYLSCW